MCTPKSVALTDTERRTAVNRECTDKAAAAIAQAGTSSICWRLLRDVTRAHKGRRWVHFTLPCGATVHLARMVLRHVCAEVKRSKRMRAELCVSIDADGLRFRWATGWLTLRCWHPIPPKDAAMITTVVFHPRGASGV